MAAISINKLLKTIDTCESDVKPFFYVQTKWLDDQIMIKLQDSETNNCYQGVVTITTLKETAAEFDIPYNIYYEECRLALTTYIGFPGYSYKLDDDDSSLKIWKAPADSVPTLYLEIPLKKIRNHYDILDAAIDELQNTSKTLNDRVEKAHKFDQNSRELLEDYRLCVEEKNQLEKRLLRKVAVLLNTKKQKIAELEERLNKFEAPNDSADNDEEDEAADMNDTDAINRPKTSRKRAAVMTESDTDTDDDAFEVNTQPLTIAGAT
uniref:XRCC4 N-terminal domain-containing protein n=1 Tax=Haematobia irritans TaxID=7368 RepID=A0A1L8EC14_HAEIR